MTLPAKGFRMMIKAIVATELSGPDVLLLQDVDLTWPAGEHDVLVELHAAGLNAADTPFGN